MFRKVLLMGLPLILMTAVTAGEAQQPEPISVNIPSTYENPIQGSLYTSGDDLVILSNMDPNDPDCWSPLIPALLAQSDSVLTYSYNRVGTERLNDLLEVLTFAQTQGFSKVVLIGASRGGVISLQAAANHNHTFRIAAVAALSAPIQYDGVTFYSVEELRAISVPKLLINSEGDEAANDTRKMSEIIMEPKSMSIYSGDAHGTNIFHDPDNKRALVKELVDFVSANSGRR